MGSFVIQMDLRNETYGWLQYRGRWEWMSFHCDHPDFPECKRGELHCDETEQLPSERGLVIRDMKWRTGRSSAILVSSRSFSAKESEKCSYSSVGEKGEEGGWEILCCQDNLTIRIVSSIVRNMLWTNRKLLRGQEIWHGVYLVPAQHSQI